VKQQTIVPAWRTQKSPAASCRIKSNADSQNRLRLHQKICPPTCRLEIEAGHGAEAYLVSPNKRHAQAALRSLQKSI